MIRTRLRKILRRFGYDLVEYEGRPCDKIPVDFSPFHERIIETVKPYTITSVERIYTLIEAVRYIVANNIRGAFAECGVYKGGSMMTVALTLIEEAVFDRELYFFDTFEGMPKPGERDIDAWGKPALPTFTERSLSDTSSTWIHSPLEDVKQAMASTGYPSALISYIAGMVEDTIPDAAPEAIALLRLDTDWYESTRHELVHLYDRLASGGVLIIDDYGHFQGARQAVDEFFDMRGEAPYLHRIDYTGRLLIKPSQSLSS